jgi:hypothetical protein
MKKVIFIISWIPVKVNPQKEQFKLQISSLSGSLSPTSAQNQYLKKDCNTLRSFADCNSDRDL